MDELLSRGMSSAIINEDKLILSNGIFHAAHDGNDSVVLAVFYACKIRSLYMRCVIHFDRERERERAYISNKLIYRMG